MEMMSEQEIEKLADCIHQQLLLVAGQIKCLLIVAEVVSSHLGEEARAVIVELQQELAALSAKMPA